MEYHEPAIETTVEGVATSVLVGSYVVGVAVDLEGRILDTVGVTSGDTASNLSVM